MKYAVRVFAMFSEETFYLDYCATCHPLALADASDKNPGAEEVGEAPRYDDAIDCCYKCDLCRKEFTDFA